MLLFICHAHEDKDDFVRPLAKALQEEYDVWFDEYQLTLGDSLLQKINEGLSTCDFGIVVFSPAFFALSKKWTRAELGGLFALESTSKKIILPIRKHLSVDELAQLLPTMGDRISVSASDGLDRVVHAIRLAVNVSERKRQLTVLESATQRWRLLDQTLKQRQESKVLLGGHEGVALIRAAFESLGQTIESALATLNMNSNVLKFTWSHPNRESMFVNAPIRITLGLRLRDLSENSATHSMLTSHLFLAKRPHYPDEDIEELSEFEFTPSIAPPQQVRWTAVVDNQQFGTEELAAHMIDMLTSQINEQMNQP